MKTLAFAFIFLSAFSAITMFYGWVTILFFNWTETLRCAPLAGFLVLMWIGATLILGCSILEEVSKRK